MRAEMSARCRAKVDQLRAQLQKLVLSTPLKFGSPARRRWTSGPCIPARCSWHMCATSPARLCWLAWSHAPSKRQNSVENPRAAWPSVTRCCVPRPQCASRTLLLSVVSTGTHNSTWTADTSPESGDMCVRARQHTSQQSIKASVCVFATHKPDACVGFVPRA